MARRLEYFLEEVRVRWEIYQQETGRKRVPFTDKQRHPLDTSFPNRGLAFASSAGMSSTRKRETGSFPVGIDRGVRDRNPAQKRDRRREAVRRRGKQMASSSCVTGRLRHEEVTSFPVEGSRNGVHVSLAQSLLVYNT